MILVDDAGGAYERIDHSPWNGCTLADFVMPFFLFIVGVAIALALKVQNFMSFLMFLISHAVSYLVEQHANELTFYKILSRLIIILWPLLQFIFYSICILLITCTNFF